MTSSILQAIERLLYNGEFAAWLNDQEMLERLDRAVSQVDLNPVSDD